MWPVLKGVNVLVIFVVLYGYMGVFFGCSLVSIEV